MYSTQMDSIAMLIPLGAPCVPAETHFLAPVIIPTTSLSPSNPSTVTRNGLTRMSYEASILDYNYAGSKAARSMYNLICRLFISAIPIYKDASSSSTTSTLILPFRVSAHRCSASWAFSRGNICDTNFFKSRIPPLRQAIAGGQVSQ